MSCRGSGWNEIAIDKGIDRATRMKVDAPLSGDTGAAPAPDMNGDLKTQIIVMESMHDDYNDVIRSVQGDIDNDDDR